MGRMSFSKWSGSAASAGAGASESSSDRQNRGVTGGPRRDGQVWRAGGRAPVNRQAGHLRLYHTAAGGATTGVACLGHFLFSSSATHMAEMSSGTVLSRTSQFQPSTAAPPETQVKPSAKRIP